MAQIEIKNMTFYYDDFYHPVFERLHVNLDTDWKMALVGRNGRGKSTLLHLLEGSLEPTEGVILRSQTVSYFPYIVNVAFTKACDVVKECIGGLRTLELTLERYEAHPCEELPEEYLTAWNRYMELDGYEMESRICRELAADGLSFCYEGAATPVFENLTVHVYPGDKIWLRGQNGTGKTTLLKLLAGGLPCIGIRRRAGLSIAHVTQEPDRRTGNIKEFLRECLREDEELTLVFVEHNEEFGKRIANKVIAL